MVTVFVLVCIFYETRRMGAAINLNQDNKFKRALR